MESLLFRACFIHVPLWFLLSTMLLSILVVCCRVFFVRSKDLLLDAAAVPGPADVRFDAKPLLLVLNVQDLETQRELPGAIYRRTAR